MGLLVRRLSTGLGYPAVVSIRTGHRSNSSNAPSANIGYGSSQDSSAQERIAHPSPSQ
ncbi:hypothetical protein ACJQWK_00918 [Exserohilum turcicum]